MNTARSFNGCWTCRFRRKKCDEQLPACGICSSLAIECFYSPQKPAWMDGGVQQEEMAMRLKREIKEKAHLRRGAYALPIYEYRTRDPAVLTVESRTLPPSGLHDVINHEGEGLPRCPGSDQNTNHDIWPAISGFPSQRGTACPLGSNGQDRSITFGRSDTILLMFYLDNVFPFLFPFYRSISLQGGKSWVLEMMISSPVVREAILRQSKYFFSLLQHASTTMSSTNVNLEEDIGSFEVLRQALQIISNSIVANHIPGAVRIMSSIMQVQRFEITVLSFENCQAHLNGALALFKQLLGSTGIAEPSRSRTSFQTVMNRLKQDSNIVPGPGPDMPSADQNALRFSTGLLIFDDIIASTALQEECQLYEYLHGLLDHGIDGSEPPINLDVIVGCQNWLLLVMADIAALDAWKIQCRKEGNLDVIKLVTRATAIKHTLDNQFGNLERTPPATPQNVDIILHMLCSEHQHMSQAMVHPGAISTRIWTHAAQIYLSIVVSGWQPASLDIWHHVSQVIDLLTNQVSPPALLRSLVWPFCVAGCFAEPCQETLFRDMVHSLQPLSMFGTVLKALEIMENVWRKRAEGDILDWDLATCFRSQTGGFVLLV